MRNKLIFQKTGGDIVKVGYENLPLIEIAEGVSVQALFEFALQAVTKLSAHEDADIMFCVSDFSLVQDEGVPEYMSADSSDSKQVAVERFMDYFVQFSPLDSSYDAMYDWLYNDVPESEIINVCQLIEHADYEDKKFAYDEAVARWELTVYANNLVESFMNRWELYSDPYSDYRTVRSYVEKLPIDAIKDGIDRLDKASQDDGRAVFSELWDEWIVKYFIHDTDKLEEEFLEYARFSSPHVEEDFYDKVLLDLDSDVLFNAVTSIREYGEEATQYRLAWKYIQEWAGERNFIFNWR